MTWTRPKASYIFIFGVGRGNSAFIRTGLNQGVLVDMGRSEDFSPADFIEKNLVGLLTDYAEPTAKSGNKIAQAVLSHPHIDHIAECERLKKSETGVNPLYPYYLTCPHHKIPEEGQSDEILDWKRIQNPQGSEQLVAIYKSL